MRNAALSRTGGYLTVTNSSTTALYCRSSSPYPDINRSKMLRVMIRGPLSDHGALCLSRYARTAFHAVVISANASFGMSRLESITASSAALISLACCLLALESTLHPLQRD